MLYEIPLHTKEQLLNWEYGVGNIPAKLPNGMAIDLPVLEATNVLTVGVTGTGKTRSYTLPAARLLLSANPQTKGVFFETKRTFLDAFLEEEDKVISYDPSVAPPRNLFQWCLIKEIRQARDKEAEMRQIAEALFSDLLSGAENNRAWVESARNTFIAVLRTIVDCYPDNTSNWDLINALRSMTVNELLAYLSKHPRNHSLLSKDFSYDIKKNDSYMPTRRATDVMFFSIQSWRHLEVRLSPRGRIRSTTTCTAPTEGICFSFMTWQPQNPVVRSSYISLRKSRTRR